MRDQNVPALNLRYWIAMILASMLGTTGGDYVSNDMGLGFAGALVPLMGLFVAFIVAERMLTSWKGEAFYWFAVLFARMTATNLGDFVARTLDLGYGWVSVTLAALLATFVFFTRFRSTPGMATPGRKLLPTTNWYYWVTLIIASVLGTTGGDFLSIDTGWGFAGASWRLAVLVALVVMVELRASVSSIARYWAVVAVIRTAGTSMGDFLTGGFESGGLELGFAVGASVVAVALFSTLYLWRPDGSMPREEATLAASLED